MGGLNSNWGLAVTIDDVYGMTTTGDLYVGCIGHYQIRMGVEVKVQRLLVVV